MYFLEGIRSKVNIVFDYQIFLAQKFGGVSRYHVEIKKCFDSMREISCRIPILFSQNEYLHRYYGKNKTIGINRLKHICNKLFTAISVLFKKTDIIHVTWYDQYIFNYKFFSKAKKVVTIHDMIHELYPEDFPEGERINKKRYIYDSDLIIAVSKNTKNDILHLYPEVSESKIKVIYESGTIADITLPIEGLPEKYILYVGKRDLYKNFTLFFKAVSTLLLNNDNLYLVCLGNEFSNEEKSLIEDAGLKNKVKVFGITDEQLNYAYKNAICFVYPSLYEGFGLPILEAMSNSCPCVLSNSSSLPEVGGNAAVYFDPEDEIDIYEKVKLVLENDSIRQDLIPKGHIQAKKFSWKKCSEEIVKEYEKLLT